jgi:hypothetical protein
MGRGPASEATRRPDTGDGGVPIDTVRCHVRRKPFFAQSYRKSHSLSRRHRRQPLALLLRHGGSHSALHEANIRAVETAPPAAATLFASHPAVAIPVAPLLAEKRRLFTQAGPVGAGDWKVAFVYRPEAGWHHDRLLQPGAREIPVCHFVELKAYCKKNLAAYKVPVDIELRQSLP